MLKMKKFVTKLPMFVSARYNQNGPEVKYSLESLFDKIDKRSTERIHGIIEEMRADIAALKEVMKAEIASLKEEMKAENASLKDAINSIVYVHGAFTAIAVVVVGLVVRYYSVGIKDEQ